jgi:Fic family protein
LVKEICEFANKENNEFIHPVIKAIILHFMIGYVHPFENGNGRAARSIFYWYVLKKGYSLFEFMPISRVIKKAPSKYAQAYLFTESDDLDLTYFLNFNLRQIGLAMDEFFEYLKQEKEEFEKMKSLMGKGLNFRQTEIAIGFTKHPTKMFTIKEIVNTYQATYETARTDLMKLEKAGYCEMTSDGRTFYYSYREKKKNSCVKK